METRTDFEMRVLGYGGVKPHLSRELCHWIVYIPAGLECGQDNPRNHWTVLKAERWAKEHDRGVC